MANKTYSVDPWWFPKICDKKYCDELRDEYPDCKNDSDEELIKEFNDGRK